MLLFSCSGFCYGDVFAASRATLAGSAVPTWLAIVAAGLVLSGVLLACSSDAAAPRWTPLLVVCGFVMTILWLDMLADEMVKLIQTIGHIMNVSTSILGLTVIAIGNCARALARPPCRARLAAPNTRRLCATARGARAVLCT